MRPRPLWAIAAATSVALVVALPQPAFARSAGNPSSAGVRATSSQPDAAAQTDPAAKSNPVGSRFADPKPLGLDLVYDQGTVAVSITGLAADGPVEVQLSDLAPVKTSTKKRQTLTLDAAGHGSLSVAVTVGNGRPVGHLRVVAWQENARIRISEGIQSLWMTLAADGAVLTSERSSVAVELDRAHRDAGGDKAKEEAELRRLSKAQPGSVQSRSEVNTVGSDEIRYEGVVQYEDHAGLVHPARNTQVQVFVDPMGHEEQTYADDQGPYAITVGVPPGSSGWISTISFVAETPATFVNDGGLLADTYRQSTTPSRPRLAPPTSTTSRRATATARARWPSRSTTHGSRPRGTYTTFPVTRWTSWRSTSRTVTQARTSTTFRIL